MTIETGILDSSDAYSEKNRQLMNMLNRLTKHYTAEQSKHLEDIFVACSQYEWLKKVSYFSSILCVVSRC